jgi:3-oxoacyl-[acyl-carrier protein] reductase
MDMGLTGRTALVTGSSRGLGRAIAEMLAAEGAAVVVHGRDKERAHVVAASIRATGGDARVAIGDLATDAGADAVADDTGDVDILVNNAGYYDSVSWSTVTAQMWAQIYQGNVVSGVRMIERLVPAMRQQGWGRVIQIGGGLAIQPTGDYPHYTATLAARHNLTVSLARDLAGTGVTANTVAPGAILTEQLHETVTEVAAERGWGSAWDDIEAAAASAWVPNDIGRFGRPDEIAAAVVFLSSMHAGYISGADLRVDGGTIRSVA